MFFKLSLSGGFFFTLNDAFIIIAIQDKQKKSPMLYLTHRIERGDILIYEQTVQAALNYIDANITNDVSVAMVAEASGYSIYHFSRLFTKTVGIPVMTYVTWRKLQFALYDLTRGKKVIDAALEYGFETHAGFTKAFTRCFGFPPSMCYMRINAGPPLKPSVKTLKSKFSGGETMIPHIIELTPFTVVGYPSRHTRPHVRNTSDAPTFWNTKAAALLLLF